GRSILSAARSQGAGGDILNVGGLTQRTVCSYRRDSDAPPAVIGGQHPFPGGIHTQVGRTSALRVDDVEELQAAVRLNGECGDGAVGCSAEIRNLVHGVQKLLVWRDRQRRRTRVILDRRTAR